MIGARSRSSASASGSTRRWRSREWRDVLARLRAEPRIVTDPSMLYIAIGIIGATVMPHNLYLHSSIVKARRTIRPAGAG